MKRYISIIVAGLMLAALAPLQTRAASNTWNNGAGNFLWDFSSTNWVSPTLWSDGDDATFGATGAGAVTLNAAVTVHNQTISANGYTIIGNGNTQTLAGNSPTNPTITINAVGTNAASLVGTNGLTIQGTGTLTLQGDPPNLDGNHYTGGTYIRSGTVLLGARGANAGGTSYAVDSIEALDAGATVKFDTLFDGTTYTSPALHQIGTHSTAFHSRLNMTGGTFDLNNEPRNQQVPVPEGTGLIINTGTAVQCGVIINADGSNHVFSGVIADGGPLVGDNSGQGPGRQIGIVSFAAGVAGGEWTLSGANTYSGSTRLQFGSIKLVGAGTIGFPTSNALTGPLRIYGPCHLDLNGHNQTIALMTSGDSNGKIYNTAVGTTSTLTFGYGNEQASRNAGMQYMDNPGVGGILAMTKIGTNCAQTLSGTNTYSGDTTVSEGSLILAAIIAVSPNSAYRLNTTPANFAKLKLTYAGTANVRQLWIDGVQQPNGVYGSGTPGIDATSTGTITVTGYSTANTWNNASGNYVWDFSSTNWVSPTIWSDGGDAIFGATGAGAVTLGAPVTVHNQTINAAGYTIVGNGNTQTLADTNPTITINAVGTNAASLVGTNGLTINGTGTLTLQGDPPNLDGNHYTGGTYIRGGTVLLGARGANAGGTSYAVDSIEALDAGATVKFDTLFDGTTYTSPALHQIGTHSTAFHSRLNMTGGTFDLNNEPRNQQVPVPEGTGLIINTGTAVQCGVIINADGSNHVFSGVIADGGPLVGDNSGQGPGRQIGIVSFAAGVAGGEWTLSGANTYSGSTRLQFGSIKLVGAGTIGFPTSNALTGPLRIYGPCHLDLNGHNQTIALMTSGDSNGKIYNTGVGTVSTLTFGYGNEQASRNAGMQYMDNPGVGGILAMRKIGTNCAQTLSGTNTYSGDTTVSEGSLILASTIAVSSNSAFRLNTTPSSFAKLKLTYSGTANVRQLWIDGVQQPNGVYGSGTPGIDATSTGTITVTGSAAVSLGVAQSGNSLTFNWAGVYKLQAKTNSIVGPWFDYPGGGVSPVNLTVDPGNQSVYYRLSTY